KLLKKDESGITIGIEVIWNKELEREILGFGENMRVLTPQTLVAKIRKRLEAAGNENRNQSKNTRKMQKIQKLFSRYNKAVFQKDTAAFLSLFAENVRIFDMWAWTYDGLPAWREMVTGWFANLGADRDVVTFDDLRIQQSGDMAVASAIARFAAVSEKGEE